MASIRKETELAAEASRVWDALRDFGAVHTRVAPGFVVATRVEGDTREVTFGNGASARERLISCDDAERRLVYAVVGGKFTHDNTAVQIFEHGAGRWKATDPGAWGNSVRLDVDYDTTDPATLFNLTVTELATVNGVTSVAATETFRNLVVDPTQPNDAAAVVNASSQLIQLTPKE